MRYAPDAKEFCSECGERLVWFAAHNAARCPNVRCKTNTVDWSKGVTEPGPVRAPTYEEAMADSRKLLWHPIGTLPEDRIVIVARQLRNNDRWTIDRFHPGDPLPPLVGAVERATHWAEDSLGTP
jgi:hypothetical protein